MTHETEHARFEITIVHGINKHLRVEETELVAAVKIAAMTEFGIDPADAAHYVLRVRHGATEVQLPEAETVEQAKLHHNQHVTLAAGTPYGRS